METAIDFINKVNSDWTIQSKVRQLRHGDTNGVVRLAGQLGYKFTPADFRKALGSPTVRAICEELQEVVGPLYVYKM
jgi:hypothetical protein